VSGWMNEWVNADKTEPASRDCRNRFVNNVSV
jgi:hypothetical protein